MIMKFNAGFESKLKKKCDEAKMILAHAPQECVQSLENFRPEYCH